MITNSSRLNAESRCTHRFANGRRCRLFARPGAAVCSRHAAALAQTDAANLSADLTAGLSEFTTAEPINQFLSRLLLLLAEDRIPPRRGAVMAYTANLLLRSVTVMHHDAERAENKRPVNIIWDIPGPAHELEQTASCEQSA
jgi:hypothetical protein